MAYPGATSATPTVSRRLCGRIAAGSPRSDCSRASDAKQLVELRKSAAVVDVLNLTSRSFSSVTSGSFSSVASTFFYPLLLGSSPPILLGPSPPMLLGPCPPMLPGPGLPHFVNVVLAFRTPCDPFHA